MFNLHESRLFRTLAPILQFKRSASPALRQNYIVAAAVRLLYSDSCSKWLILISLGSAKLRFAVLRGRLWLLRCRDFPLCGCKTVTRSSSMLSISQVVHLHWALQERFGHSGPVPATFCSKIATFRSSDAARNVHTCAGPAAYSLFSAPQNSYAAATQKKLQACTRR